MLTIRNEQMTVLGAYMRQSFEERMLKNISANFPRKYQAMLDPQRGDANIRRLIQEGMTLAAGFGIKDRKDVAGFVHLMVGVAPDFLNQPHMKWVATILNSKAIPNRSRMAVVFQQLPERHPEYEHLRCPEAGDI